MLHWKICYAEKPCISDEVRRRKRFKRKDWYGPLLLVCTVLLLLLCLPPWCIALIVSTVLIALGAIFVLG